MRDRQSPALAPIAPLAALKDRLTAGVAMARLSGAASTLAIAGVLGILASGDAAAARNRVMIDESVLESLGPEPSIASMLSRPPRTIVSPTRAPTAPPPRAVAQAPGQAPRSRLLLPGSAAPSQAPQIAAAPPALKLPPMTTAAAAPAVKPAPMEAPRSRFVAAPALTPPSQQMATAPTLPAPILAAPPAPLLPTPAVAPLASGVRAAPPEAPRSQLLLPPPAPVATPRRAPDPAPTSPAPVAATPWPSLAGAAVAAPLPPTIAAPPPAPAPVPARPAAAAAPTARDIQPPAPLPTPAVAPSAVPPAASAKPSAIGARLLFQRGTLDPADGSREALNRLAAQLAGTPNRRVQIMAYALGANGETENSNEARRLSLDRALAVRSGLVQQGVRSTQVTVRALGNPGGGDGPPDRVDILLLDE